MPKWKKTSLLALLLHSVILISELTLVLMGGSSAGYFRYFTNLSNILAALASLCMVLTLTAALRKGQCKLWRWAVLLQLVAASGVGLTFLTVLVFLAPDHVRQGGTYLEFFSGEMFHTHFLNCVLSGVGAMLLHADVRIQKSGRWLGLLPAAVYACVYGVCVFRGLWPDFYNLTFGLKLWAGLLSAAMTAGVSLLLSLLYSGVHNRRLSRYETSSES